MLGECCYGEMMFLIIIYLQDNLKQIEKLITSVLGMKTLERNVVVLEWGLNGMKTVEWSIIGIGIENIAVQECGLIVGIENLFII